MWKHLAITFALLVIWQHACFVYGKDEYSPAHMVEEVTSWCADIARTVGTWMANSCFWIYDTIKALIRAIKLYELWQSTVRLVYAFLELGVFWFGWFEGVIRSLYARFPDATTIDIANMCLPVALLAFMTGFIKMFYVIEATIYTAKSQKLHSGN